MNDLLYFSLVAAGSVLFALLIRAALAAIFVTGGRSRGLLIALVVAANAAGYVMAAEEPSFVRGDHWSPLWWLCFCALAVLVVIPFGVSPRKGGAEKAEKRSG